MSCNAIESYSTQLINEKGSIKRKAVIQSFQHSTDQTVGRMSLRYMAPYPVYNGVGERNVCRYYHGKWTAVIIAITALITAGVLLTCSGCSGGLANDKIIHIFVSTLGSVAFVSIFVSVIYHLRLQQYLNKDLNKEETKSYLTEIKTWAEKISKSPEARHWNVQTARAICKKLS